MPIVNGRVHIDRPRLAPHHRVAYGVGIGVAVAVVVAGWIVTVGSQLKTLASSAIEELHATGDTIGVVKEQTSEAFRPVGGAVGEAKNAFVQLIEDANQKKDAAEAVAGLVKDQLAHDAEVATPLSCRDGRDHTKKSLVHPRPVPPLLYVQESLPHP